MQRGNVGIDHRLGRRVRPVNAGGHALQVDLGARSRDGRGSLADAVEIHRQAAGVEEALVPDLHCGHDKGWQKSKAWQKSRSAKSTTSCCACGTSMPCA